MKASRTSQSAGALFLYGRVWGGKNSGGEKSYDEK